VALGVFPAILAAVSAVAPVVFTAVDQQQQRKRERKDRKREALADAATKAGGVSVPAVRNPDAPSAGEWATPLLAAGATAGAVTFLMFRHYKKSKQAKIAGFVTLGLTGVLVFRAVRK
jgi:hypothetical protein